MFIRKKFLIVLSLVLFVVAALFAIISFEIKQKQKQSILDQNEFAEKKQVMLEKKYSDDLNGSAYLTLKNKKTGIVGIYEVNLGAGVFSQVYTPQGCFVLGGELNSAKNKMLVSSNCGNKNPKNFEIYSANIEKESQRITSSGSLFKKESVWSPDEKKIAFTSFFAENENASQSNIDNWFIYTSNLEGKEEFVVGGATHPFFSPDGKKILALRKAGVFLFDTETRKGERIYDFGVEVPISMHLELSDQKDRLAIANSINQDITILEIKSWDKFEMEEVDKISTVGAFVSWPKFDPNNNKYIMYEELYQDGKIALVAYNLETKEKQFIVDLSNYEPTSLWINDWK